MVCAETYNAFKTKSHTSSIEWIWYGCTVGDFIMSTWTTLRKIKIEFEKIYILNIIIKLYILYAIDYLHIDIIFV